MTTHEQTSLRIRLRTETRVSHEGLDEQVSRFDLTTEVGFASFLSMQTLALRTLAPHAARAECRDALHDLLDRAAADLSGFETADHAGPAISGSLQPLSIDYVIAGSRLGTRVLRERWLAATDERVRRADAYFSAPGYIELWKSFCASAGAMPAAGPLADRVVRDADRILHFYSVCASAPYRRQEKLNA
jgi:heme oxygenase